MIFDDGLVYDVSVTDESLQDINLLMKLPKSEQYFGYSDGKGVVYFIHRWFSVGICRYTVGKRGTKKKFWILDFTGFCCSSEFSGL